ncbi:MAG: DUF6783 domain-containing protein [Blautia faecis]
MCVTICGRFCPVRRLPSAKWGVQIAGMIFQTRSGSASQI